MGVGRRGGGGGKEQKIREMHRMSDRGIEHMGLLARCRFTVSNTDGYQERHDADGLFHSQW